MQATLLKQLDLIPPFIVRRLARTGLRATTTRELAQRSGLSIATIKRISRCKSWGQFTINTIMKICHACGHDPLRPTRALKYLRNSGGFHHLSPAARKHFAKLLKRYA